MNQYRHVNWLRFRQDVIKLHDGCCSRCLRTEVDDGAILQVHHKRYVQGRLPWEYPTSDCEALCKGCHAIEHGHIMPRSGWNWIGVDDLGDLVGECELCGTELRYVYAVEHPAWGALAVGTDCCDKLTQSNVASEYHAKHIKFVEARKRFVSSKRWTLDGDGSLSIMQKGIAVRIIEMDEGFAIIMNGKTGKLRFGSVLDAKIRVFDVMASGEAVQFLQRNGLNLQQLRTRAWLEFGV